MNRPVVLITGFEPFGNADRNVSSEAVTLVAASARLAERVQMHAATLPVVYDDAPARLRKLMRDLTPDVVICCGIHRGDVMRIERTARNLDNSAVADNAGTRRENSPIVPDADEEIPSGLPVDAIQVRLEGAGIPSVLSDSAGGFLCNHTFFRSLHDPTTEPTLVSTAGGNRPVIGFIHVPPLNADDSPFTLERVVEALELVVEESLDRLGARAAVGEGEHREV